MVNFIPEQIQDMKEGRPLSGLVDAETGGLKAQVYTPSTSTPIEGYGTNVRPRIRNGDGSDVGSTRVTRPSGKQLAAFNKLDEEKKIAEAKAAEKYRQEIEELSPQSLHSQVQYLTRAIKKLQKELNQLKANTHDS